MITMGTIGGGLARNYSSQAAEHEVYDAPKKDSLVEDASDSTAESEEHKTSKSGLDEDIAKSDNEDTLVADAQGRTDDRTLKDVQIHVATEDGVMVQHERQDGILEISPTTLQPGSEAMSGSGTSSSSGNNESSTVGEGEPSESDQGLQHGHSKVTPMIQELDAQDDWQEFEEDPDAENWQGFQEYESDPVETLEDLDLLRALNRRTLSEGVEDKNLPAHVDSQTQPDPHHGHINRTIHILGLGAAGKYIAHSLASLPFPPPITLLMHRPLIMQRWHDEGAAIHVIRGGEIQTQTNFHIESSAGFVREDSRQRFPGFGPKLEHTSEPPNYPIDALIVTTEAYRTVSALTAIKRRLGRSSTIFVLNNGLGLVERINEKVFPDPNHRPTYILGNMTHNLESTERHFTLIEKNPGRLECSKFPQVSITRRGRSTPTVTRKDFSWTAPASHLVGALARTPEFSTVTLGHKSFYESQFQNLAAGAVIGPLSVVFDCTNDLILYNYSASQTMKLLLREISWVIRSLPELQSLPGLDETFGVKRLEAIIVSKISKTGKNLSAMLQSVRAGNRTNIDYYNGYIERRARELGIDTPRNQMMLHLVKGKSAAKSRELKNHIPFEDDY